MKMELTGFPFPGILDAPSSKSAVQRAVICAAFADRKTEIICNNFCDDIKAAINAVKNLGAEADISENAIKITPIRKLPEKAVIDCNESGAVLRFMIPVCAFLGIETVFHGSDQLMKRPIDSLLDTLKKSGCFAEKNKDSILIGGNAGNQITVEGNVTSQYVSGLMLAAAVSGKTTEITIENGLVSSGYVEMTSEILRLFGISILKSDQKITVSGAFRSPGKIISEGDWSSAAYFAVAAALSGKEITIRGLNLPSHQPDTIVVDILRKTGAEVRIVGQNTTVCGKKPKSFCFDADGSPDLVPALAALACGAEGKTEISGISRLKYKETDRISTVCECFSSLGTDIRYENDKIIINGTGKLIGGECRSFGDHRIAMAAASVCPICENGVLIRDFECVSKSFPLFADIINGEML